MEYLTWLDKILLVVPYLTLLIFYTKLYRLIIPRSLLILIQPKPTVKFKFKKGDIVTDKMLGNKEFKVLQVKKIPYQVENKENHHYILLKIGASSLWFSSNLFEKAPDLNEYILKLK